MHSILLSSRVPTLHLIFVYTLHCALIQTTDMQQIARKHVFPYPMHLMYNYMAPHTIRIQANTSKVPHRHASVCTRERVPSTSISISFALLSLKSFVCRVLCVALFANSRRIEKTEKSSSNNNNNTVLWTMTAAVDQKTLNTRFTAWFRSNSMYV